MNEPSDDHAALATRAHRLVLVLLAVCAVAIVFLPDAGSDDAPPPIYITAAMGSAVASVIFRRLSTSPVMRASLRAGMAAAGYALALVIGAAALALAVQEAQRQNALLFVAGAIILSLRPPVRQPQPTRPA